jgi:hypothetical protein
MAILTAAIIVGLVWSIAGTTIFTINEANAIPAPGSGCLHAPFPHNTTGFLNSAGVYGGFASGVAPFAVPNNGQHNGHGR